MIINAKDLNDAGIKSSITRLREVADMLEREEISLEGVDEQRRLFTNDFPMVTVSVIFRDLLESKHTPSPGTSIGDNAILKQAQSFKKLRALMGYIQDGSDVVLTLSQDDATGTFHLASKNYGQVLWSEYADSLAGVIDIAHENHAPDEQAS